MQENDPVISRHLTESTAFNDLYEGTGDNKVVKPVIVTSGEFFTPFFVNSEKLTRDSNIGNILKSSMGKESASLIDYAVNRVKESPEFGEDISILALKVEELLPRSGKVAIAGGQTRDWLFSGPVAASLDLPHISIYKPGSQMMMEIVSPEGRVEKHVKDLSGYNVVHVVDLLTKGSSCYNVDPDSGEVTGWVPELRNRGAEIDNLVSVVTRLQGGEERLAGVGVTAHPTVAIDKTFLVNHSSQLNVDLDYVADPRGWTIQYMRENGIGVVVPYFQNDPKKLPRAKKFMHFYQDTIKELGLMDELEKGVKDAYGISVSKIMEGK